MFPHVIFSLPVQIIRFINLKIRKMELIKILRVSFMQVQQKLAFHFKHSESFERVAVYYIKRKNFH